LLDTDTAYTAHKKAYLEGVLHCDISPGNILIVDGGGLLIDWDMCEERNGNEALIGYRTSRTGTWPFMAADLIVDEDHKVTQTFIHDLESAFYVLLYQALRYRHTSLTEKARSTLHSDVFNTRTVGGLGSRLKLSIMGSSNYLKGFKVLDSSKGPCNEPFTGLIEDLKKTLGHRHALAEYPERSGLSAFLDDKDYEALPYRHNDIIALFSDALKSSGWPVNDGADKQPILDEDREVSFQYASTKRGLSAVDSPDTSSGRSLKRLR